MTKWFVALFLVILGTVLSSGTPGNAGSQAVAILAGGCFWCVEHDFKEVPGVLDVVSGYSGGSRPNPTYENYHDIDATFPVPHVEVAKVTYDPTKISYDQLLDHYFRHIDPTDAGGQFCDRGPAYRPVIFVMTGEERAAAEARKAEVARLIKQPVAVEILDAGKFWPAEDYHQDYAEKNPIRYNYYRWNCGRDRRIEEIWRAASG
jgi:peptide-methionine (S)-S-oxide reductase